MARFLYQSRIRNSLPFSSATRLLSLRHRSGRPDPPRLIEITLDSPDSPGDPDLAGLGSRLEDAIHAVISRRSAPDWLPFLPGASYWVPPRVPYGVVEVVGKIAAAGPLFEEEALSMASVRGWPSSSFFVEDEGGAPHPAKRASKKKVTESEDEEG